MSLQVTSHSSIARFNVPEENEERPSSADLTDKDIMVLQGGSNGPSRPNTTHGRMPSKLSQPVFSRSSYHSNVDYSTDSDDDDESDQFLITEVKEIDDDLWRAVDASKRKSNRLHSAAFGEEDEDDGYWDTDLEVEGTTTGTQNRRLSKSLLVPQK